VSLFVVHTDGWIDRLTYRAKELCARSNTHTHTHTHTHTEAALFILIVGSSASLPRRDKRVSVHVPSKESHSWGVFSFFLFGEQQKPKQRRRQQQLVSTDVRRSTMYRTPKNVRRKSKGRRTSKRTSPSPSKRSRQKKSRARTPHRQRQTYRSSIYRAANPVTDDLIDGVITFWISDTHEAQEETIIPCIINQPSGCERVRHSIDRIKDQLTPATKKRDITVYNNTMSAENRKKLLSLCIKDLQEQCESVSLIVSIDSHASKPDAIPTYISIINSDLIINSKVLRWLEFNFSCERQHVKDEYMLTAANRTLATRFKQCVINLTIDEGENHTAHERMAIPKYQGFKVEKHTPPTEDVSTTYLTYTFIPTQVYL